MQSPTEHPMGGNNPEGVLFTLCLAFVYIKSRVLTTKAIPTGVIRVVWARVCLVLRYLRCRKRAQNGQTEPAGVPRRRTQVRREVKFVSNKKAITIQNCCKQFSL